MHLNLSKTTEILDAGSGTGGNLAMLSSFGHVCAMEMDAEARALADKRGIVTVEEGEFPDRIPFADKQFGLVAMFDVLEHIEQDFSALTAIHARLADSGKLLLTVPAFELLWSMHDTMHHHKRRYSLPPLIRMLERAGYKVTFASYINFWLFPLIALVRVVDRLSGGRIIGKKPDSNAELSIPPAPVNRLLEAVFASESGLIRKLRLPFGVSILLVAEKA
jgi:SAM-dependent methyltransferase